MKADQEKVQNRSYFLLAGLLFVLPVGNQLVSNLAIAIFLLHSFYFLGAKAWGAAFKNAFALFCLLFIGWYAISVVWAENSSLGFRNLETKLSFFLLPLSISAAGSKFSEKQIHFLLKMFLGGVFVACAIALGNALWLSIEQGATYFDPGDGLGKRYFFHYERLAKPIMHPGYFSTYIGTAVLISCYFISIKQAVKTHIFLLQGFLAVMLMLQGRINLIALFLVLGCGVVYFTIAKRKFKLLLIPLGLVAVVGIILSLSPSNFTKRFTELPNFDYDISGNDFNSATYRLAEWHCALDVIYENPVLGVGVGDHTAALMESYQKNGFKEGLKNRFNAHNQYIETTLATGVIGLLGLLMIFVVGVKRAVEKRNVLLIAVVLFFALCILTESMFERAWGNLLFTTIVPTVLLMSLKSNNHA